MQIVPRSFRHSFRFVLSTREERARELGGERNFESGIDVEEKTARDGGERIRYTMESVVAGREKGYLAN